MATKKKSAPRKTKRGPFGAKSEFIRSMPHDMPAKQVVEEGQKTGLKFTVNYVYGLRTRAKQGTGKKRSRPPGAMRVRRAAGRSTVSLEGQLRNTIAELGLAQARQVFAEIEAAFGGR